jgi:Predicted Rossmann fold nucleotide-binding protein
MLRGKAIPKTTTDQRLLDRRGPSDWVHTDPWRVLRIQAEFVEGFGLLAELGMAVSVFGSARAVPGTRDYDLAERISRGLAGAGYAVITGGGPGSWRRPTRERCPGTGSRWAWASSCRWSRA